MIANELRFFIIYGVNNVCCDLLVQYHVHKIQVFIMHINA